MNHKIFEEKYVKPKELYFDNDKHKYQITNEAAQVSEFELVQVRRLFQQYNSLWSAYQHGLNDASVGA